MRRSLVPVKLPVLPSCSARVARRELGKTMESHFRKVVIFDDFFCHSGLSGGGFKTENK